MATLEERIAALEAMLAALGTPDDYYVSRYSGEEIDELLSKAGTATGAVRYDAAQSLTAAQQHTAQKNIGTTWPCNPNLLDNWYFGNPVNQRGRTSYTVRSYTIDRWFSENDASVSISADGLTAVGEQVIIQKIEKKDYEQINGRVVTVSILLSDGTFSTASGVLDDNSQIVAYFDGGTFMCTAFPTANSFQVGRITVNSGQTKTFLAVKLELGDTQTLAHQDANGNWVLNEIPDYGEQLRRCQRYFTMLEIPTNAFIPVVQYGGEPLAFHFVLDLPVEMRTKPAVVFENLGRVLLENGAMPTLSSTFVDEIGITTTRIACTSNIGSALSSVSSGWFDSAGKVSISADL